MTDSTRLLVERRGGHDNREERLVTEYAHLHGIPVIETTTKAFLRNRLAIGPDDVVAGGVPFVRAALQSLGGSLPPHVPYPGALAPWLYRIAWHAPTLGGVLGWIAQGGAPVFVKPDGWKRFTGFVADHDRPPELVGVSRHRPVWCSTPVVFASEWRVYMVGDRVLDVRFADHGGDRSVLPDHAEIARAIAAFAHSPTAPSACVVDFGVLASGPHAGKTALVEANDGFSFGAYDGVAADVVWAVTATRWRELAALAWLHAESR